MTNSGILVVGSSNTDMVIKASHLPAPGETILGGAFMMNPGGKGANQAVAAARLAGQVTFICKTGNDIFGRQSVQLFQDEGIDITHILNDPDTPSGVALITVDDQAENCIVVASGSNATLSRADLLQVTEVVQKAGLVLLQLEIPLDTVMHVAEIAALNHKILILNPAPACHLPDALFEHVTILTPNQKEAEMLSGIKVDSIESAKLAAAAIRNKGVHQVIITLGDKGALVLDQDTFTYVAGTPVKAVDTTAAGDVFNGALAVALSEDKNIIEATRFACQASAIAVTRAGAQSSSPYRSEISSFVNNLTTIDTP